MSFEADMQLVTIEQFDASFPLDAKAQDEAARSYATLFVDPASVRRGGNAVIYKARNYRNEALALKVLQTTLDQTNEQACLTAFREEYRVLCTVSKLRGFPCVHGTGFVDGQPAIIMEWVEGVSLKRALEMWREVRADVAPDTNDDTVACRLPLKTVASLGVAVTKLLSSASVLEDGFVHRDLSPSNIMLRTDKTPALDQLESGNFDLCLIDLGSASFTFESPSFTERSGATRHATPDYAAPEMLTADVKLPHANRHSSAIDTYALCSILYELYCGHTPYQLAQHADQSPYRVKTEGAAPECPTRFGDGGALARIIEAGLALEQDARPSIEQLQSALENWLANPLGQTPGPLQKARRFNPSMWQPDYARHLTTRRRFIAAGIVGAGILVSAAIVGSKLLRDAHGAVDYSAFPTTDAVYSGEPLFKIYDREHPGWALSTAAGQVLCKPDSSRECGRLSEGLVSCYSDEAKLYGHTTPDGQGGYAWKVLPRFAGTGDFCAGMASAQDASSRLWGYIDTQGTWVIKPAFRSAGLFSNDVAAAQDDESGLWGAIDTRGAWAVEPQFAALGMRSAEGYAIAQTADASEAGAWGIVDSSGTWSCNPEFASLRRFAEGRAPACVDEDGPWGFVDGQGQWIVKPQFADARPFASGLAAVQDQKTLLWYFIEKDGRPASGMEPRFWKLGELRDGLAPAQASAEDDAVVVESDGIKTRIDNVPMRYGYVDTSGHWQLGGLVTLVDTAIGAAEI